MVLLTLALMATNPVPPEPQPPNRRLQVLQPNRSRNHRYSLHAHPRTHRRRQYYSASPARHQL